MPNLTNEFFTFILSLIEPSVSILNLVFVLYVFFRDEKRENDLKRQYWYKTMIHDRATKKMDCLIKMLYNECNKLFTISISEINDNIGQQTVKTVKQKIILTRNEIFPLIKVINSRIAQEFKNYCELLEDDLTNEIVVYIQFVSEYTQDNSDFDNELERLKEKILGKIEINYSKILSFFYLNE